MTDNELLLALSDILDKKLDSKLAPLKQDIQKIKDEQVRINLIIENEIRQDIKLLAENYLPVAKRYERDSEKIGAMQEDIKLLKKVVREHSEKLNHIA